MSSGLVGWRESMDFILSDTATNNGVAWIKKKKKKKTIGDSIQSALALHFQMSPLLSHSSWLILMNCEFTVELPSRQVSI